MSHDVTLNVGAIIDPSVPAAQAALDETIRKAKEARRELMSSINTVLVSTQYMVSAVRLAVRATGNTLDPMQNAALTMVQSAVSAALAMAGLYAATGVLAAIGFTLAIMAAEISFVKSAEIMAKFAVSRERLDALDAQLSRIESTGFTGVINVG